MSEVTTPLDSEKEKRTNQKLAIGVGVLGLGAFGALYVVFFLVMILKPGLIFSMMPENITTRGRFYVCASCVRGVRYSRFQLRLQGETR